MKKAIVSVTSDLITDARVHKVSQTLQQHGWEVTLVGRKMKASLELTPRIYKTNRLTLFFEKGFLFYAEYNIRLFFYLLFHKADVLVSNDLDTLLPNYIISKLKNQELFYDTHEYFTGVPELSDRRIVRGIWEKLEQLLFRGLQHVYTVNQSIADLYEKKYMIKPAVIRNVPERREAFHVRKGSESLATVPYIIIYQGAVNRDRGLEEMIDAMNLIPDARLLIVGAGDVLDALKKRVISLNLGGKVTFTGKVPFGELSKYTDTATIGLCIEKDTNINYRYCLPNKLFDYIQAGVPVLSSPLVEIRNIVDKYDVGSYIKSHNAEDIAESVNAILADKNKLLQWKQNTIRAASELNWQAEEKSLLKIYGFPD